MEGHRGLERNRDAKGKGRSTTVGAGGRGRARGGAARVQADQACRRGRLSPEGPGTEQEIRGVLLLAPCLPPAAPAAPGGAGAKAGQALPGMSSHDRGAAEQAPRGWRAADPALCTPGRQGSRSAQRADAFLGRERAAGEASPG